MKLLLFFALLTPYLCSETNEFVRIPKKRTVSLSRLKRQAADAFSEQLRLSASSIHILGSVLINHAKHDSSGQDVAIDRVKKSARKIYQCCTTYADLLNLHHPEQRAPVQENQLVLLVGNLLQALGQIQERIIGFMQDILDDTGSVFTRQQIHLPEIVRTITLYTKDFQEMYDALHELEKRVRSAEVHPDTCQKANESNKPKQRA